MSATSARVRLMTPEDFDAVVGIDAKILGAPRPEYYRVKFAKIVESSDSLPISLVAEREGGKVVGFVMGDLYVGEYGIFEDQATIDTIGVDPDCRHSGIGRLLIDEFVDHVKRIGVRKISTLVSADDRNLTKFFGANRFFPSRSINLERTV